MQKIYILKMIFSTVWVLTFVGCGNQKKTTTQTVNAEVLTNVETNTSEVTETIPTAIVTPKSLALTVAKTTLNKDDNTTVEVVATYADNSTTVLKNVEWVVTPKASVNVNGATLTAKKDNNVTLQAKVGTTLSNTANLNITWIVDGYTLPPEPDKALNDSTLLGIDSNNNGVRDDVERYIYERFMKDPEYPKTKTALAMQYSWATQKVLEMPTIESKKYLDDSLDCESYWIDTKTRNMSGLNYIKYSEKHQVFNDVRLKDIFLNTKQRILRKFKFNEACSGHVFHGRKTSLTNCTSNIDILGE